MNLYVVMVCNKKDKDNGKFVNREKDNYTADIDDAFKAKTFESAKRQLKEPYEMVVPLDDIKG